MAEFTSEEQYRRACRLVTKWEAEIKAMSYEEREHRRKNSLPPFDRYRRAIEMIAIHEWGK